MSGAEGGAAGPKSGPCTALRGKDEVTWGCDVTAHLKGIRITQVGSNHSSEFPSFLWDCDLTG